VNDGRLRPELDSVSLHRSEKRRDGAEQRHAYQRHDFRLVAANLHVESVPPFDVLARRQIVDSRARTRDQIRDAESKLGQPRIVAIGDRLGHQS